MATTLESEAVSRSRKVPWQLWSRNTAPTATPEDRRWKGAGVFASYVEARRMLLELFAPWEACQREMCIKRTGTGPPEDDRRPRPARRKTAQAVR